MKTKITVIVDNIDACGLAGEWGLCMIAEYGEKKDPDRYRRFGIVCKEREGTRL